MKRSFAEISAALDAPHATPMPPEVIADLLALGEDVFGEILSHLTTRKAVAALREASVQACTWMDVWVDRRVRAHRHEIETPLRQLNLSHPQSDLRRAFYEARARFHVFAFDGPFAPRVMAWPGWARMTPARLSEAAAKLSYTYNAGPFTEALRNPHTKTKLMEVMLLGHAPYGHVQPLFDLTYANVVMGWLHIVHYYHDVSNIDTVMGDLAREWMHSPGHEFELFYMVHFKNEPYLTAEKIFVWLLVVDHLQTRSDTIANDIINTLHRGPFIERAIIDWLAQAMFYPKTTDLDDTIPIGPQLGDWNMSDFRYVIQSLLGDGTHPLLLRNVLFPEKKETRI